MKGEQEHKGGDLRACFGLLRKDKEYKIIKRKLRKN